MSSGFVTEAELEEKRKIRQQEWEKVREADQPKDVPEEPYDHRSLFDKLEEQKQKKQIEFEEAHKLKNMIRGLDDDEIGFLEFVDRKKMEAEQVKEKEEKQELEEFRAKVGQLRETSLDQRLQAEIRVPPKSNSNSNLKSQQKLLQGAVVKRKQDDKPAVSGKRAREDDFETCEQKVLKSGLTCVGILPGLGSYVGSDSDSDSSCSEVDRTPAKYDLLGRKLVYETKEIKHTQGKQS